jgi:hypothetical protein
VDWRWAEAGLPFVLENDVGSKERKEKGEGKSKGLTLSK